MKWVPVGCFIWEGFLKQTLLGRVIFGRVIFYGAQTWLRLSGWFPVRTTPTRVPRKKDTPASGGIQLHFTF